MRQPSFRFASQLCAVLIWMQVLAGLLPAKANAQQRKNISEQHAAGEKRIPKTIFIIADGIPADVIEKLDLPNLQAVATAGRYARAYVGGIKGDYTQTPTISAPGYNDLLTGTWGNKHNVKDNDIAAPNYNYYTIFRFFKEANPSGKTAVFSTWTDNRTKLLGDGLTATDSLHIDYSFDGYEKDTVNFPHDSAGRYMLSIDERVIADADAVVRKNGPDLSWIYLENTDEVGHRKGTGEEFEQAVMELDKQIGTIWRAIQFREQQYQEDWQLFVTTDHGRDAITGSDHGGQSDRERTTWILTNTRGLNVYFSQYAPAIVDILPTIARHLNITIPEKNSWELDGVPLSGPVSVAEPELFKKGDSIVVHWKALQTQGLVNIILSTTDHFKEGGTDDYRLMTTISVNKQEYIFPASALGNAHFCKIVIKGKNNTLNRMLSF